MTFEDFKKYKSDKKLFAVIGDPIGHSASPILHQKLFECEKTDAEYIAVHVKPDELEEFVKTASKKLCGFNITIPHKNAVIPFLDETDDTAQSMGSVNTVKISNSKMYGYNTDIYGVRSTLSENNLDLKGARVCVLGSGGAARSVVHALLGSGADITVARRRQSESKCFADDMTPPIKTVTLDNIGDAEIVINTTPVGMSGFDNASPVKELPKSCKFVFDVIYTPLFTPLLKMAADAGIPCSNGLHMLLMQGVKAEEIWLEKKLDELSVSAAGSALLSFVVKRRLSDRGKKNILLSGFMGCGKTTVGRRLSKMLSVPVVDIDAEICKRENMTINEIFERHGENYFRQLERKVLSDFSQQEDIIISGGGGAMTFKENFDAVRSSLVIYMKADEEFLFRNISRSSDRPLMRTDDPRARIHELLTYRSPLYEAHCDETVNAANSIDAVAQEILSKI